MYKSLIKSKYPYQLIEGDAVMVSGEEDYRIVKGVKWVQSVMRYRVYFVDGSSIDVSRIKTVPMMERQNLNRG